MKTIIALALALAGLHATPITSGTITFFGQQQPVFDFSIGNIDVYGTYQPGYFQWACSPCRPGDRINVSGAPGGSSFATSGGTYTENGVTIGADWWDHDRAVPSRFEFGGVAILVTGPGTFIGTTPFLLTGQLCGNAFDVSDYSCPIWLPDLTGSGTASVTLYEANGVLWMQSATLTFGATPPMISNPEPQTWVLMGVGLAAVVMVRRRRGSPRQ